MPELPCLTTQCWANLLDQPGAVFPVTHVDKAIDHADSSFQPRNEDDRKVHADCAFDLAARLTGADDPEVHHGAPVTLQLVARRLEEEKLLAMVEVRRLRARIS